MAIPILAVLLFSLCRRPTPEISLALVDGTRLSLVAIDSGHPLCYGGGFWQHLAGKALGRRLPSFVKNQPFIFSPAFTNGAALLFRRTDPRGGPLTNAYAPRPGSLCFVEDSGVEKDAVLHAVNFQTEKRGARVEVLSQEIFWETPRSAIHLVFRDTDAFTNPALIQTISLTSH